MKQKLIWHPEVHKILTESLHIFAIEAFSYIDVFDKLQEVFQDSKYTHPVYLTYGMLDIFMFFWLNTDRYSKTEQILKLSLGDDGGTLYHMSVDDIYYHCGRRIPQNKEVPILADYDLHELNRAQEELSHFHKFSDFFIGKVKPPKQIAAFVTITQYKAKADKKERSKIIHSIQRIFKNPHLSDNLYGLYSGSDMADVLLEIQIDDFNKLQVITESIAPISALARANISTYILKRPITLRNDICQIEDPAIEGLKGILAQKFPRLNDLDAASQTKLLNTYQNFKPWFRKVADFIEALIDEDIDGAAQAFTAIGTKFETNLKVFIKKYAANKWGRECMKKLLSIHPKQQKAKDTDYRNWTLGLLAYSLQSLNSIENWTTQEQFPLIHDFVEIRNKLTHAGSHSVPLSRQEKTLLNFLKVINNLPKDLRDF